MSSKPSSRSNSEDEDVQIDESSESEQAKAKTKQTPSKKVHRKRKQVTESPKTETHLEESESEHNKDENASEKELEDIETKNEKLNKEEESYEEEEDYEEEEEEEEIAEKNKNVPKYDFIHPSPILRFQYRSIAATLIRAVNLFRNSMKLGDIAEDTFLTRVAMKHSLKMASGETKFSSAPVKSEIASQPYAFYFAHVSRSESPNHAFLDVANEWATNPDISQMLLSKANMVGVGMATSLTRQSFFTLIVALRSYIGDSSLVGDELRSVLISRKSLSIVNQIRQSYKLPPYVYDPYLSKLCYKLCSVPAEKITQKFIASRLPNYSATHVDFGKVKVEDANPNSIVEDWMRQTPHVDAILGDFNRIGIGINLRKGY